jgi:DMSO/TMAO reductase YedYZ heme-binding membrane subunit
MSHALAGQFGAGPDWRRDAAYRTLCLGLAALSLLPTVAPAIWGVAQVLRVRWAVDLCAFLYAALYLLIYVGLDHVFQRTTHPKG